MKQNYLQKATDTYFNQVMFHANNPERHTVGVAGPTRIKNKNNKGEETPFKLQKSASKKGGEKVGTIVKKSINQTKKLNSARKETAPIKSRNPIVTVERTSDKGEVIPLQ